MDVQYQKKKKGFTLESVDESFIFYDTLVRRVWIEEGKRPVVRVTGSHKYSCLFGAIDIKGQHLFRQYDKFNSDTFLDFLKLIHTRFAKCYLFLDKASPDYKSKKVKDFWTKQRYSYPDIPSNSISWVYDVRSVEYSQTRSACTETLSIVWGF